MDNVFVWRLDDVLFLGFLCLLAILFIPAWLHDKYAGWKKRRKATDTKGVKK